MLLLLTCEPPYARTNTIGAALRQIQKDPPRRVRDLQPGVPAGLSVNPRYWGLALILW